MSNITISDLRPVDADLLLDSESYLNDLTEGEMINILGLGHIDYDFTIWGVRFKGSIVWED